MDMKNREKACTKTQKATLRAKMHDRMKALPRGEHASLSKQATACLMASAEWQQAKTVYLFVSMGNEIDTHPLLNAAWEAGKILCLPRCRKDRSGIMDFWPCSGMNDLAPGVMGILEPPLPPGLQIVPGSTCPPPANPAPDLVLLPALACSPQGGRLGYGGGYYDRFFASHFTDISPQPMRVAFCFALQIVPDLYLDPWDQHADRICTEQGLVRATHNNSRGTA